MKKIILLLSIIFSMQVFAQNPRTIPKVTTLADSTIFVAWHDSSNTEITRKTYLIDLKNFVSTSGNDSMWTSITTDSINFTDTTVGGFSDNIINIPTALNLLVDSDNNDTDGAEVNFFRNSVSTSNYLFRIQEASTQNIVAIGQNTRLDFLVNSGVGLEIDMTSTGKSEFNDATITVLDSGLVLGAPSAGDLGEGTLNAENGIYAKTLELSPTVSLAGINIAGALPVGLDFRNNDSTPNDQDAIGLINLYGKDSGNNATNYGSVAFSQERVTNGEESAAILFSPLFNGSTSNFLYLDGYEGSAGEGRIILNQSGDDVDFILKGAADDSVLVANSSDGAIFMDGIGSGTGTGLSRVANTDEIVEETSSIKFKKNVRDWNPNVSIMNLRPRRFTWNEKSAVEGKKDYGLIKEEVQIVLPEVINGNMWHYGKMITYLVSVNQEQMDQRHQPLLSE